MGAASKSTGQRLETMNPRQLRRESQHFCSLLEDGRAKYAKGRNYDAVEKLRKALAVGAKKLPRFDDNSLVKAHALLELGLACGAVCTDHATGDEWRAAKDEADRSLQGALGIFHARLAAGTLTTFRNEEMWMQGGAYKAPVSHPERLGPIDFLSCTSMALATMDPSPETIANLEKAIAFHAAFERAERRIDLEEGRQLQAQGAPTHLMNTLRTMLAQHEQGTKRVVPENWRDTHQEMRQVGTTGGAMLVTKEHRRADVAERGLNNCAYCGVQEKQPRQYKTCSQCRYAAYCCREHQKAHWRVHKRECATESKRAREEHLAARRTVRSTLMPGQQQQFMTLVAYLHTFCVNAPEMRGSSLPSVRAVEDHANLSIPEINLIWDALLVETTPAAREPMLRRFVREMRGAGYTREEDGGPPWSMALAWNTRHVSGAFAVVEHTPAGSILLHERGEELVAYRVVGISQSVEEILSQIPTPLPVVIRTAILPFHDVIVTNGCIAGPRAPHPRLEAAAAAAVGGIPGELITSLPGA